MVSDTTLTNGAARRPPGTWHAGDRRARLPRLRFAMGILLAAGLASLPSRARAEPDDAVEARALFEGGLEQSGAGAWQEAANLFERSRALVERPATVLNLLLVYEKLERPLAVVRAVQDFLSITDPVRHKPERQQALEFEARAYSRLGRVRLRLEPPETQVSVSGKAPLFANEPQTLLLEPGVHELTFEAAGYRPAFRQVAADAGVVTQLPVGLVRLAESEELVRMAVVVPPGRWRGSERPARRLQPRVARAFGVLGTSAWLGAVAAVAVAVRRADALARTDPQVSGFLTIGVEYTRVRRSVVPLAFIGSGLMSGGLLLARDRELPRFQRTLDAAVLTLTLGAAAIGAALWAAAPADIGDSSLSEPRREIGAMLISTVVPGVSWLTRRILSL